MMLIRLRVGVIVRSSSRLLVPVWTICHLIKTASCCRYQGPDALFVDEIGIRLPTVEVAVQEKRWSLEISGQAWKLLNAQDSRILRTALRCVGG